MSEPQIIPCSSIACLAKREQEGEKLQTEPWAGDIMI